MDKEFKFPELNPERKENLDKLLAIRDKYLRFLEESPNLENDPNFVAILKLTDDRLTRSIDKYSDPKYPDEASFRANQPENLKAMVDSLIEYYYHYRIA